MLGNSCCVGRACVRTRCSAWHKICSMYSLSELGARKEGLTSCPSDRGLCPIGETTALLLLKTR